MDENSVGVDAAGLKGIWLLVENEGEDNVGRDGSDIGKTHFEDACDAFT